MTSYDPRIGDYGVVRSNGIFARLIQIGTVSRWNHAFVYIGDGQIIEANPRGIEVSSVFKYPLIAWNQHEELDAKERHIIVEHAKAQIGKPYNFLVIANLALRILGLKVLANTKLLYKMAQKDGYICSELVAECYKVAGADTSIKAPDLVTPGDLAERLVYM
jgi:uncharacterized protein YycO